MWGLLPKTAPTAQVVLAMISSEEMCSQLCCRLWKPWGSSLLVQHTPT